MSPITGLNFPLAIFHQKRTMADIEKGLLELSPGNENVI
jgi:hypothetical protein